MFRSLAVRNYRLFAMGQIVSNTGTWMQRVAQDWLVLQLTDGSAIALGVTTALQFLPMLLFGLWGGVLADRYPKRRVLLISQALMGVIALGLGLLALTGTAQVLHVYAFALALGVVTVIDNPTRQTFVVEMVGKHDLANAIALNSAMFQFGRVLGPAVAGLAIAAIGTGPVFLVNAASYIGVLAGLYAMRASELHTTEPVPRAKGQLRAGLSYVNGRADLKLLLVLLAFVSLFGTSLQPTVALMTTQVFQTGAGEFGLAATMLAVGSLGGALLAARRARPRLRLPLLSALAFGAVLIATAFVPNYVGFLLVLVPLGVLLLTFNTAMNAMFQLSVDPQMRGRVMGLYMLLFAGMAPIGAPVFGAIAELSGARAALVVGGAMSVLVAVVITALLARSERVAFQLAFHPWPRLSVTRTPRPVAAVPEPEPAVEPEPERVTPEAAPVGVDVSSAEPEPAPGPASERPCPSDAAPHREERRSHPARPRRSAQRVRRAALPD
ncbi:MFS transporter [Allonocardiopsis opalescens]|uniref:Putative MFS family arabinose efflux permease n=1 Tax=Allonocardiopsis opalescens TaxID=1144618 RepID=A0A2T0Q9Y3_9ACTN|nr:MFS transporter [Allonocardiopsis opalescens]PRY00647.1 putative MFS family arabinose efflux permease [Allonocardiopsis opalescens]